MPSRRNSATQEDELRSRYPPSLALRNEAVPCAVLASRRAAGGHAVDPPAPVALDGDRAREARRDALALELVARELRAHAVLDLPREPGHRAVAPVGSLSETFCGVSRLYRERSSRSGPSQIGALPGSVTPLSGSRAHADLDHEKGVRSHGACSEHQIASSDSLRLAALPPHVAAGQPHCRNAAVCLCAMHSADICTLRLQSISPAS